VLHPQVEGNRLYALGYNISWSLEAEGQFFTQNVFPFCRGKKGRQVE